jgi:hypothetical protein
MRNATKVGTRPRSARKLTFLLFGVADVHDGQNEVDNENAAQEELQVTWAMQSQVQ